MTIAAPRAREQYADPAPAPYPTPLPEYGEIDDDSEADDESAPPGIRPADGWPVTGDEEEEAELAPGLVPAAPPPPPEHVVRAAVTSRPAGTRVEWARYYGAFPAAVAVGTAAVALGVAGGVLRHPALYALAGAGAWTIVADVVRVRRAFRAGEVCPAVVVAQRPPLVAVRADLSATGAPGPRPAVKMLHQPLRRLTGGTPIVGTRLAAVATHRPPVRRGTWADFDPTVLRCATTDEVEVGRVTGTLGEQDWRELDDALAQCPSPRRPGLRTLWDDNAHGRRRSRWRWTGPVLATGMLAVAIGLLVWYAQDLKPEVPPDAVPGRVHTDWGR
jgi:hypothetical protein